MRIGIDLGGTKIEGIVLDAQGEMIQCRREPTRRGDYQSIVNQVVSMVLWLESEVKTACSVGIGIPGSLSPGTGLVRNANTTELNTQAFKRDIEQELESSVFIANDANCFALSEATDGAASNYDSVFGVILGTGVGGGIVQKGKLLEGANGIAGEWGHNPLPWMTAAEYPGRDCYCGRKGCIETFLSGPALEADHLLETEEQLTAKQIAEKALLGDAAAIDSLNRFISRLARALAHVCNLLDPEAIVLGGGLSAIEQLYDQLPGLIEQHAFCDQLDVKLLAPKYGDSSGVRGAAWLPGFETRRSDNSV